MLNSPSSNTAEDRKKERDRESYLRWQALAITQLGYTINLFLTLAVATLGFALKILMESQTPFSGAAHCLFYGAMFLVGLSIAAALAANVTRALDFRYTRRATRERMTGGNQHDEYQRTAECYGSCTWRLFYIQTVTFALGVTSLGLSICLAYRGMI